MSLFLMPNKESGWSNDDWQTPTETAKAIAKLIKEHEKLILEPAAGTGQIVWQIPEIPHRQIISVEKSQSRYNQGFLASQEMNKAHYIQWVNYDFLGFTPPPNQIFEPMDLIIGNPPFSLGIDFIEKALGYLKPTGRILFLLPIDFYCGLRKGDQWRKLNCHIKHQYSIQNRVAYLDQEGKPRKGRQVYDAVFDISPGKKKGVISFL